MLPPNERTPAKSAKDNQPVVDNSNIVKATPPVSSVSLLLYKWTQLPSVGKENDPKVLNTAENDGLVLVSSSPLKAI